MDTECRACNDSAADELRRCVRQMAADGLDIDDPDEHPTWTGKATIDGVTHDVAEVVAERDRLREHFDAAAPEHNLLALLAHYVEEADARVLEAQGLRARVAELEAALRSANRWIVMCARDQETVIELDGTERRQPRIWDHACAECIPDGELVIAGFRCAVHAARAALEVKP